MNIKHRTSSARVLLAVWFLVHASGAILVGVAQSLPIVFTKFSLPEYYDPPHETQMKSLLQGDQALPEGPGRVRIKQPILKTYRVDGTPGFVLEAEDCIYDSKTRTVTSAGALEFRTADGRFLAEGEGFHWQDSASTLTISNRVHTRIRVEPTSTREP